MTKTTLLMLLATLFAPLAASCGGGTRGGVFPTPLEYPNYPTLTNNGNVWAEATFFTNHAEIFGMDLTKKGLLPVALRVGIRGEGEITSRLAEDTFDPHVYLQDGTVLGWFPADQIERKNKRVRDRVTELALGLSLLRSWDSVQTEREQFVFFAFPTDTVQLRETSVLTSVESTYRELDLLQSLVAFTVATENGPRTVSVGLKARRW